MGDSFHTTVGPATGVFTGSGTQNNNHYHYYSAFTREAPRLLVQAHLLRLERHFVRPEEYRTARRTLRARATVLIRGAEGSGRRATAQMLLHEHGHRLTTLREVPPERSDGTPGLSADGLGEKEGLLLDLTHSDKQSWNLLQRELPSFQQAVQNRGSLLVVVLPSVADARLDNVDLQHQSVAITRPDPMAVLKKALDRLGEPALPPEPPPDELARFLDQVVRLNEVAHLATLIEQQWLLGRSSDPSQVCKDAVDGLLRSPDRVADRLSMISWPRHKALLLSTAMLEAGRPSAVSALAETFLQRVEQPETPAEPLARPDLAEQFEIIDALHDADGRIRFAKPGFAEAVRSHFWDYRPWLRQTIRAWVIDAVSAAPLNRWGAGLDEDERIALVESYTRQLIRTETVHDLTEFAAALARRGGVGASNAAISTLRLGLDHPVWAQQVRRQLYVWANESAAAALYPVLIETCRGPLAAQFPDQALVRLHHMARRSGRDHTALRAIQELVTGKARIRGLLFDRLAKGMEKPPTKRADIPLFLQLSAPSELLATGPTGQSLPLSAWVTKSLTRCWRVLLTQEPAPVWNAHLESWLRAVHEAALPDADRLLDILVTACGDDARAFGLLYSAARHHPLHGLVLERINRAQGYDTSPAGARHKPTGSFP